MAEPRAFPVDAVLATLEAGNMTEAQAVAKCGELAQSQLVDFDHLRAKNEALYRKVMDWCKAHPPEL